MTARVFGGVVRSSESAIPVLRAAQCDTALGPHITLVRATTGTRYNSAGTLVTMAAGQARINYDPVTLTCLGALFEEQRSNLLPYAEQRENAAWVNGGTSSTTANALTAPTGATVADKLVEAAVNNFHFQYQIQSVSAAARLVYTDHFKAVERQWACLQGFDGSTYPRGFFNLSTGALGVSADGAAPAVVSVGGGWHRCAIAWAMVAGTTAAVYTLSANADNSSFYTGDGVSGIGVFGAMLEAATADYPRATSYIPTVAAQATRDADNATVTGAAFTAIYNAAAWGAFLQFHLPNAVGIRPILCFDDGTANNRIEIYGDGTSLKVKVVTGGTQQCDTVIGTIASNTVYKLAISQAGGVFKSNLNAAAEATATAASMPTVDRARIGHNQAGNYQNGHSHTWDAYRREIFVAERLNLTA